jgi:hypothetical protein
MHYMQDLDVKQASLIFDIVNSCIEPCVAIQKLKSIELELSKNLACAPQLMFTDCAALTLVDLASLNEFYKQIPFDIQVAVTPFADGLQQATPNVETSRRAYEHIPSVEELRDFEILGASLAFGAKALRLETQLTGIAIGLGVPIKNDRFSSSSKELIVPFVGKFPLLQKDEADRLLQKIQESSMPSDETYTQAVRKTCSNVVRIHAALSILCF